VRESYPEHLRVGDGGTTLDRRDDVYAVRRRRSDATTVPADAVALIPDEGPDEFVVYRGRPDRDASLEIVPVYSAGRDGTLAVPTGRIFVRLREGLKAEERRDQFAAAGFTITKTLSYAPAAAWLEPSGGNAEAGLSSLDALERVRDVAHVEAQVLMERATR
jgi:hypothetical protein